VLLAEDDRSVRTAIERLLRLEGYDVRSVADGAHAIDAAVAGPVDVVVLDVMMPFVDGLSAAAELRRRGVRTPILFLTARDRVADRVAGLDAGGDDYLVKPFAAEELLARLRALLRRGSEAGVEALRVADLVVEPARREARRGERRLELTKTEFDLLELLVRNAGIVVDRDTILERVWGLDSDVGPKALDVYVGYVRRKTELAGEPRLLHTVRGVGYVVRAP
jgi:two-component system response regulator MprA